MSRQYQQYKQVERAIDYLQTNFRQQPSLAELAAHVGVSPDHFQRVFMQWAGVSPKAFVQLLSLHYAKAQLAQQQSLLDAALATGLSGPSRLHDLFIKIVAMTPASYKHGAAQLSIVYSLSESIFGNLLVASTTIGVCHVAFIDSEKQGVMVLRQSFPFAWLQQGQPACHQAVIDLLTDPARASELTLHLRATPFQLQVWQALLTIPNGQLRSYGQVAAQIERPHAARAVGTAIGQNPIAGLIPCHRVICASGALGGYRWGLPRKAAILGWEAVQAGGAAMRLQVDEPLIR